jgi:hypothetical protein
MNSAKQKAKELVDKMFWVTDYQAIQSSLTAVEEIINELKECGEVCTKSRIKYWQEVEKELTRLE